MGFPHGAVNFDVAWRLVHGQEGAREPLGQPSCLEVGLHIVETQVVIALAPIDSNPGKGILENSGLLEFQPKQEPWCLYDPRPEWAPPIAGAIL